MKSCPTKLNQEGLARQDATKNVADIKIYLACNENKKASRLPGCFFIITNSLNYLDF